MTEKQAMVIQASTHPAEQFRQMVGAVMGVPTGSFAGGIQSTAAGGGHGVVNPSDLAVAQHSTPNMSVDISAGSAFITGSQSANQKTYQVFNDATVTYAVSTADPTNPRKDLVVAKVQDAFYSGATNAWTVAVVTGTPAASPVDPAVPANSLVLARVTVPAAAASIVNANIADLRTRTYALGGIAVCSSTTHPSAPYLGQVIAEFDTARILTWDGGTWVRTSWWGTTGATSRTGLSVSGTLSQSVTTGPTLLSWDTLFTNYGDSWGGSLPQTLFAVPMTGLYSFTFSATRAGAGGAWDGNGSGIFELQTTPRNYFIPISTSTITGSMAASIGPIPLTTGQTFGVLVGLTGTRTFNCTLEVYRVGS